MRFIKEMIQNPKEVSGFIFTLLIGFIIWGLDEIYRIILKIDDY